jgi:hypothetical protein
MSRPLPAILPTTSLSTLLTTLLAQSTASTETHLIICSSSTQFLHTFLQSTSQSPTGLSNLTLRQLNAASHISTSFCPSISSLLALLAVLPYQLASKDVAKEPELQSKKIVIVSPLSLLSTSGSPSVQVLAQILCAAVECANIANWELEVIECVSASVTIGASQPSEAEDNGKQMKSDDENMDGNNEDYKVGNEKVEGDPDLWDIPIPILSNTVGKLKLEKAGWTSRSVTPRTVASRWFRFSPPDPS